ncbi:MAG: Cyclin-dependent kinases regulatory subunit (Cell division control protein cks1) [Marteilia pararefringens]
MQGATTAASGSTSTKSDIYYSEKYSDSQFEYRHVHVSDDIVKRLPRDRLLSEREWRELGIQQSRGWQHYMIHRPEPNILLFKRPLENKEN